MQNYFLKNFYKNSSLDDSGISLPIFPSRTNLKLHNIIINIILHCIPVVVLKNCEPELSYILAELFNKYFKESCFPDCWKVSSVVPLFKNVGKVLQLKTTALLVFSLVSKVFEKLVLDLGLLTT